MIFLGQIFYKTTEFLTNKNAKENTDFVTIFIFSISECSHVSENDKFQVECELCSENKT